MGGSVEHGLDVQGVDLVEAVLGEIVVGSSPGRARVIEEHCQAVRHLPYVGAELQAAGFVLQVCYYEVAVAGSEGVEASGCLFELALLAAGDDDSGTVLDEGLGCHLTESGGAACDEDDMVGEAEELRGREVGG